MKELLDTYPYIDYKVLNTLGADVNYGGRVTDDKDIRLIRSILSRFYCPGTVETGFKFSDSGIYKTIEPCSCAEYLEYIN
jgi:dynein heavy chain